MIRIGGHLSISGGLSRSLERAQAIEANCLQIFSSPPQKWQPPVFSQESLRAFKQQSCMLDIRPVVVHGTYLINLASDNQELVKKSMMSLIEDLRFCHDIGALGVVFHFGSNALRWEGINGKLVDIIYEILNETPSDTLFIIENSAGSGTKIGATIEELQQILIDTNHQRIRCCIDTAHAFAAGYDIRTKEMVDTFAQKIEHSLSWDLVEVIHLNDSKAGFGTKIDRHENIAQGHIGEEGLQSFVSHPLICSKPFILETPGFEKSGPNLDNIRRVKSYIL